MSDFTGESPWICTIEDRAGKVWSVWLNRAVLVGEFERHRPMPGERVALRYRGKQEEASRAGAQPAHLYALTVQREQALPEFLTKKELAPGEQQRDTPDVPIDNAELPPAPVPDAEVVSDDVIPF